MIQSADSGPIALPRGGAGKQGRAVRAGAGKSVPSSQETLRDPRVSRLDHLTEQPLNAADVAQARHFEAMLRAEIAQLEHLARQCVDRRMKPSPRGAADHRHAEELAQLRARIGEARRLLETLRRRFPPSQTPADPRHGSTPPPS
ncbi:hypothetical protein MBOT_31940 [Mycobacterium botniense]|uniref:Uncharacterized protein n=1 Tax=Mycobacterium botniense TaxID=84962 RepID=A0A7I9Y1A2_9MYCO|nr:hypothetical protein MBOT_31940 [Mycobacterium botniense]